MKLKPLAPFILCCLLGILPNLAFGVPWDPNRPRPAGFQRTLAYLENDLFNYPQAELQSVRNSILHDDLVATVLPKLKAWDEPPSRWAELVQQQLDQMRTTQYEAMKTIIRQTMNNPEGIIQAVEGNQPIEGAMLAHPNVIGLISLKWQMLSIAEQIYQALIHEGLIPGGGSVGRPSPPTDIGPPKPGKGPPGLDWERMRESRRRAIERRRAVEERWAREAERRLAELNELLERLIGLRPQSRNKFQARPLGSYVSPAEPAAEPAAPDDGPPPAIEEIEQIEEEIAEAAEKMAEEQPAVKKPVEKVTVYRGTLTLRRPPDLSDESWQVIKQAFQEQLAQPPGTTDLKDNGDVVTWRYKLLKAGGHPFKHPLLRDDPDAATTEEVADGKGPPPAKPKPKFTGNGDADPRSEKIIPGTEKTPVAPKPEPPQPEVVMHDGYWFDPTDKSRDDDDPFIYVRVNGGAQRILLSKAPKAHGVPDGLTIDQMTWYNERTGKIEKNKNLGTHRSSSQPASTNKFAKPKP